MGLNLTKRLKALWKYYGYCAAQLYKSQLLTKLKSQTVRQPAFSLAAYFPFSLKCILKTAVLTREQHNMVAYSQCVSESFPSFSFFPMQGEMNTSQTPQERGCHDNLFLGHLEGQQRRVSISGELLVVYKSCRTLCMDGESGSHV